MNHQHHSHHETALDWFRRRKQRPSLSFLFGVGCPLPQDSASAVTVLEGSVAKTWTLRTLAAQWVTTTPHSVVVLNGEDVQIGLASIVQAKKTPTDLSVSAATTTATTAPTQQDWLDDCLKRIFFATASIALLEVLRHCETPLLLLWDDYEDDPEMTRQLGRLLQDCPQLSVVVAGRWSGGVSRKVQLEKLSGEHCLATVSGKQYKFRLTIQGIVW